MKNKKNIYILLPLVILLWGLVIYRFLSYTAPQGSDQTTPATFSVKPIAVKKRDTVVLNVNYRDPFLGKMYDGHTSKQDTKKRAVIARDPIQWPQVVYKGLVTDNKNKKKVFMLIINGRTYLMKENESVDDIVLKSGNRNSITVKYKGDLTDIMIQ